MPVKSGLVLEGGAMRGIFTAGALDYLMKKDMTFDYVVGVSAGSGNAVNYVSGQPGRTRKVIMHENAQSYYGLSQLFENRKILNLETMIEEYALKDIPFDFDAFFASSTLCESVVVNCEKGAVEYKGNYKDRSEFFLYNMATCSVPFICEPVKIGNFHYLDGSIIDSIPLKRAYEVGCDKAFVIMTKPEGALPTDYSKMRRMIEMCYKSYPRLCEALMRRSDNYAKQAAFLKEMTAAGKAFVIRPSEQRIHHFEKDMDKLQAFYRYGYDTMKANYDALCDFLNKE